MGAESTRKSGGRERVLLLPHSQPPIRRKVLSVHEADGRSYPPARSSVALIYAPADFRLDGFKCLLGFGAVPLGSVFIPSARRDVVLYLRVLDDPYIVVVGTLGGRL